MDEAFVTVDMGGTQTRAALCDARGEILERAVLPTPAKQGAAAVADGIFRVISEVWPAQGGVRAIGAAVPGPLNPWTGVVLCSPNIPGWEAYPLKSVLEEKFGVVVRVNDDANAAALGEHRFGAGRGKADLVYLTIGTGVGSGIIVGHRLLQGSHGVAGEAGHMILADKAPLACGCGRRGCLESLISGPSLAEQARLGLRAGQQSLILQLAGGDPAQIDARIIGDAAAREDPLARGILDRAGTYLGLAVVNLMLIFDPEIVIVGGSVSRVGDLLLEPARQAVRRHGLAACWGTTPLVPSELGDDAGLRGAFCLVGPPGPGPKG